MRRRETDVRRVSLLFMVALSACATTPSRYEIEYQAGAVCILATDGIGGTTGESWQRCVRQASLELAEHPEAVPIVRDAWQNCKSSGIAAQSSAMDDCLKEEIMLGVSGARQAQANAEAAGRVVGILLRGAAAGLGANDPPTQVTPSPLPPAPVFCTSQPDGWGGTTTVCH